MEPTPKPRKTSRGVEAWRATGGASGPRWIQLMHGAIVLWRESKYGCAWRPLWAGGGGGWSRLEAGGGVVHGGRRPVGCVAPCLEVGIAACGAWRVQAKDSRLDLRTAEARRAGGWANRSSPKRQAGQFFSNHTT